MTTADSNRPEVFQSTVYTEFSFDKADEGPCPGGLRVAPAGMPPPLRTAAPSAEGPQGRGCGLGLHLLAMHMHARQHHHANLHVAPLPGHATLGDACASAHQEDVLLSLCLHLHVGVYICTASAMWDQQDCGVEADAMLARRCLIPARAAGTSDGVRATGIHKGR